MIKLQIVGNLGKDCIVKEISGKSVINFSVVHSERFKDSQGNQKERAIWVECAYWTDRTAVAPYLVKGQTIYAEGTPEADAYMNKDGQAAATLRMRVQSLQLVGGSARSEGTGQNSGQTAQNAAVKQNNGYSAQPAARNNSSVAEPMDDLPF